MAKIDIKDFLNNLTDDDIIDIVTGLGAHTYINRESYIIFPTICHNEISEEASLKLYYYKDNKVFVCYTECGDAFNIFELYRRVNFLKGIDLSFSEILYKIIEKTNYNELFSFEQRAYKSETDKYKRKQHHKELEVYEDGILKIFQKYYPPEWVNEGITYESLDKYNILYSISRNKIIIPHYNINNELIGIRGRALNDYEIEEFGKYMPIKIEDKWYAHPLSYNLYGLNISKDTIEKNGNVIIYEGEKSCLKHCGFFPEWNVSVAACGFNFNKSQLDLLIKNFNIKEITLAFDKEYKNYNDSKGREYFSKLENICKKYSNYSNFSFIFDKENLLNEKDSPIDKGKEVFEKLYKNRIKIRGSRF